MSYLLEQHYYLAVVLLLAIMFLRLGEYRVHRYQYDFLDSMGAEQTANKLMRNFYLAEAGALILMGLELIFIPKHIGFAQRVVALGFMMSGVALRHWARHALGRTWSLLLMYVPDIPRVSSGPYRWLRHPEYLSRYLELFGFSLFFGAYYGFGCYVGAGLMLLPTILLNEDRQLNELAAQAEE